MKKNSETKTIKDYLENKDKEFLTLLDKYLSGDASVTKQELEYSAKIALVGSASMVEKFNELLECYPKDKLQAEKKFQELLGEYMKLCAIDSIPAEYFKGLKLKSEKREKVLEIDLYNGTKGKIISNKIEGYVNIGELTQLGDLKAIENVSNKIKELKEKANIHNTIDHTDNTSNIIKTNKNNGRSNL